MSMDVYLNGRFVPYDSAAVPLEDRGLQFSESIYEVVRVYRGRPFEMDRHMGRFRASAQAIGLDLGSRIEELESGVARLVERSGLQDAAIYIQATSGAAPRAHLRPSGLEPTVLAMVGPIAPLPRRIVEEGLSAITVPDDRWARCYVKTTMLVSNALAKRRAAAAGCDDAIFVRDGFAMEATAANLFAVFDGELHTPPASNYILHGVTRAVLLEIAEQLSIPAIEGPIPVDRLYGAQELFLTGTVSQLGAITTLDRKTIGSGRPGPMVARLREAYHRRTQGE